LLLLAPYLTPREKFSNFKLPKLKLRNTVDEPYAYSSFNNKRAAHDASNRDSASSFLISHRSNQVEQASGTWRGTSESGANLHADAVNRERNTINNDPSNPFQTKKGPGEQEAYLVF
jgi:hypothetical protein